MSFTSDFGILTVVPEAFDAAMSLFDVTDYEDALGLRFGVALVGSSDGGQHVVTLIQIPDRSNPPAAEAASSMLRGCEPRHLIVADIGGGLCDRNGSGRDGLELGDVVVATDIQVRGTRLVVQSLCDLGLVGRGPL